MWLKIHCQSMALRVHREIWSERLDHLRTQHYHLTKRDENQQRGYSDLYLLWIRRGVTEKVEWKDSDSAAETLRVLIIHRAAKWIER